MSAPIKRISAIVWNVVRLQENPVITENEQFVQMMRLLSADVISAFTYAAKWSTKHCWRSKKYYVSMETIDVHFATARPTISPNNAGVFPGKNLKQNAS